MEQNGENERLALLCDEKFLDSLYGFSYNRCSSRTDAEDLCGEILLRLVRSMKRGPDIGDFNAYVWAVARKTYADFSQRRRKRSQTDCALSERSEALCRRDCDDRLDELADREAFAAIRRRIAFLSDAYRDAMVLYYFDGLRVDAVAARLGISENTVKQRLFSARKTIRKEVLLMNENDLLFKPVDICFNGSGDPVKSHPYEKADRLLSKNVLYLCREKPRTAKEIAEALGLPMLFAEEELYIQCRGSNGTDGLLRKTENGRYLATFPMLRREDFETAQKEIGGLIPSFADRVGAYLDANRQELLALPYRSRQDDPRFIAWSLILPMSLSLGSSLWEKVREKYFKDTPTEKKDYYPFGFVFQPGQPFDSGMYGWDGINAANVCGYKNVHMENIYGKRIRAHFHCGENIARNPLLLLALRAIGGLPAASLSEEEKEPAAKAIAEGYLRRAGDVLEPAVLVMDNHTANDFRAVAHGFEPEISRFAETLREPMAEMIRRYLPAHLYGQASQFVEHCCCGIELPLIEACIARGILSEPKEPSSEGTVFVVQK